MKQETSERTARSHSPNRQSDPKSGGRNSERADSSSSQLLKSPSRLVGAQTRIVKARSMILLSGVTFVATCLLFPDIGWWPLGYICLVPWLVCVCTSQRGKLVYFVSWLLGLGYFLFNIRWMPAVTLPGYLALSIYQSLYFPLAAWPIRHLYKRHNFPVALTAPVVWVATEYLRSIGPLGFPWVLLGQSQYTVVNIIQICDLVGIYGVSFVLVMVNGWLTDLLIQPILIWRADQSTRLPIGSLTTLLVVLGTLIYGSSQRSTRHLETGPRVAIIQHDFPMYVDSERANRTPFESVFNGFLELARQAAAEKPDLIVLPETAMQGYINDKFLEATPGELDEIQRRRYPPSVRQGAMADLQRWSLRVRDAFQQLCNETGVPIVIGSSSIEWKPTAIPPRVDAYNSAFLLKPGRTKPADRYDKVHLVLFGEYVPFRFSHRWLYDWLNGITPWGKLGIEYTLSEGSEFRAFEFNAASREGRAYRAAAPICYEEIMPYVTRAFVRGVPASRDGQAKDIDMLLTISNDGWFLHSAELEQHLAASVFRAVEHRIAVARSVNTGASAIIHPNGKIHNRVRLLPGKVALLDGVDAVLIQLDDSAQAMDARADQQQEYMAAWTELRKALVGPLRTNLSTLGREFDFMADRLDGMMLALAAKDAAKRRAAIADLRGQLDEDRRTIARWKERPDTAPGYSVENLKCDNRITLYTRWGDWFAQGAVGLVALMLLDWTLRRIFRKKTERGLSHG
jgi:apolipoprotein N-acyltransferase